MGSWSGEVIDLLRHVLCISSMLGAGLDTVNPDVKETSQLLVSALEDNPEAGLPVTASFSPVILEKIQDNQGHAYSVILHRQGGMCR